MTGVCVLTFHRLVDTPGRDHDVTWDAFGELLDRVVTIGASVVSELARRGLPGIFFVPAAKVDAPGYLKQEEVRELQALGHVIGSHAYHHAPLDERSRDLLSDLLETKIRYFAPPGGITSRFLTDELERHGFTASRSMRLGLYGSSDGRWSIPCIPVTQFSAVAGSRGRSIAGSFHP